MEVLHNNYVLLLLSIYVIDSIYNMLLQNAEMQ